MRARWTSTSQRSRGEACPGRGRTRRLRARLGSRPTTLSTNRLKLAMGRRVRTFGLDVSRGRVREDEPIERRMDNVRLWETGDASEKPDWRLVVACACRGTPTLRERADQGQETRRAVVQIGALFPPRSLWRTAGPMDRVASGRQKLASQPSSQLAGPVTARG